ncbi:hypothetical protein BpHYR1_027762 [Brachionus plicatilis]|uniref:Uncharacterized protein n=1 Tax=Brachionus plicatilis TaxID=10195 RepID=A0A3M7RAV2_BRAPC|nr:hypothetical protein BpHYR1_027762 [Brachionus plicatilis]
MPNVSRSFEKMRVYNKIIKVHLSMLHFVAIRHNDIVKFKYKLNNNSSFFDELKLMFNQEEFLSNLTTYLVSPEEGKRIEEEEEPFSKRFCSDIPNYFYLKYAIIFVPFKKNYAITWLWKNEIILLKIGPCWIKINMVMKKVRCFNQVSIIRIHFSPNNSITEQNLSGSELFPIPLHIH